MTDDNEIHRLLHTLWTKAVGTPGYDKKEWLALERCIEELRSGGRTKFSKPVRAHEADLEALDGSIAQALRELADALVKKRG